MALINNDPTNIGAVILAAGESSRLGTPKQLLKYAGQSLLQHSIETATASGVFPVVVVLGSNADIIKKEIDIHKVPVVINNEWQEGMASSIRYGIKAMLQLNPSVEGTVMLLCDQPHITPALLATLVMKYRETGKLIVACQYRDTFGPPVFFHHTMFPDLLLLKGDIGAKSLISRHVNETELVSFPGGNMDVDTEADYQTLLKEDRKA